jgi:L-asparaginase
MPLRRDTAAVSGELVHIALGGTISMRIIDGLAMPMLGARELAELAELETTPVDLATVGGPQLDFPVLTHVVAAIHDAERDGARGVLVTLGTDAIEEVSAFLTYCGPYAVNVVITGSMEPGGEPGGDAAANLRDAAAVSLNATLNEPVVVFAGSVFLGRAAIKVSGLELDAFTSQTSRAWTVAEVLSENQLTDGPAAAFALGDPGEAVEDVPFYLSALSAGLPSEPLAAEFPPAIVCVASGAGNLTPEVAQLALAALDAGSIVGIASRALDRQLTPAYGYPGGSGALAKAGAVLAAGMSPHRLRIFLLIAVSQGLRGSALRQVLLAHVQSL